MENTPLAVIGGGNMGHAIVAGGLSSHVLDRTLVVVAEPDVQKHAGFASLGVTVVAGVAMALESLVEFEKKNRDGPRAQLLLAVKPPMLDEVASEIRPWITDRVVISVLAGTPSPRVRAALGPGSRVVRAMPNLPAKIRQGATALCRGDGALPGDDGFAQRLFTGVGPLVVTIDESLIDAFTAVAGSGPAYVFYLAEAMTTAAIELGFDPKTAGEIVRQTVAGAGNLLAESREDASTLRTAVTSKGGTTQAALKVMDSREAKRVMIDAIMAARDRGAEIASGNHGH